MENGDTRTARYVLGTTWESLPEPVQHQTRKCAIDLVGALASGTMTRTAAIMANLAATCFPGDAATVVTGRGRSSLPGAALANGFAINAFDVDDGHRLIKGHPGAAVFPALLAAAEYKDLSLVELLSALAVSYEVSIRAGLALHRHYGFYHGSGSWGSIGAAAGVSRLLGLDPAKIAHSMGAAEYHGPLAPVMRPVSIPTMNKDGIGWGNMVGMMSALMAADGFTGAPSVLGIPEAAALTETLGHEFLIMDLYFKPFTCCRWAHPAVSAVIDLKKRHGLVPSDVAGVDILTFSAAAALYTEKPTTTEEAQYNVLFPVAAALAAGEVGPRQVLDGRLGDPDVLGLMDRMRIKADDRFDRVFPSQRLCEVEVTLKDGKVLRSGVFGPVGEPEDCVSMDWIADKFRWLTRDVLDPTRAEAIVSLLAESDLRGGVRELVALLVH
jgi:2-methylcitrate dehydratase PrpD